jgi:hypothetical protein
VSGPRRGGDDERTAPEITVAEGISADGPVDEVALDVGEDTAGRGLLDPWTASRSTTGDEATASGRTGELSEDGGGPTDVRLLGELLGFAGPDPEQRARELDAAPTPERLPPSGAVVDWVRSRPVSPVAGLVSNPEPAPPALPTAPPAAPAASVHRGFWPGLVVGAVIGLVVGVLALFFGRG